MIIANEASSLTSDSSRGRVHKLADARNYAISSLSYVCSSIQAAAKLPDTEPILLDIYSPARKQRFYILSFVIALMAGIFLRAFFIWFFPGIDDDSLAYGSIANNLLAHHAYSIGDPWDVTLIRLPGYPLFLALVFRCFGADNYTAVRWVQLFIDLFGCLLISSFVRENVSTRASLVALWVAALCPFTANYVAIPMTETLSIFCVSLALLAASRLIRGLRNSDESILLHVLLVALALCMATLLRPDGVLLDIAVIAGIIYYARDCDVHDLISVSAYIILLIVAVLAPWTARNYIRFHVFQPLAPRYANNPGESVPYGFLSWNKTWEIDYVSSLEVFWKFGASPIDLREIPKRAFDSDAQRETLSSLIADYNSTCDEKDENCDASSTLDQRFGKVAAEFSHRHLIRSLLLLPALRVADMWVRPRVEYLPVPLHWWEWKKHPTASLFSWSYLFINFVLLFFAFLAFARGAVPFSYMSLLYIVCRCLLLATLSNAETRYTLECYPIIIAAAAIALAEFWRPRETTAM